MAATRAMEREHSSLSDPHSTLPSVPSYSNPHIDRQHNPHPSPPLTRNSLVTSISAPDVFTSSPYVHGDEGALSSVSLPQSMSVDHMDPGFIMQQLHPAIGNTGCIRNPQDAPMVVSFMKQSTNLMMHRCIILNVIKATDSPSTLAKFMDVGGWGVLNTWLAEAKRAQNYPLLLELLVVLQKLPVSIDALKQGNMGKIVKQLSKLDNTAIQNVAGELLAKWMTVFREGQQAKSKVGPEDRRTSADSDSASSAPPTKSSSHKKEKKAKKKDGKSRGGNDGPPPESVQLPPGPMVALGRPKEKSVKRARDVLSGEQQLPVDKKSKIAQAPADVKDVTEFKEDLKELKPPKVLVESEGFMNALSTQAAKMKEKKVKKPPGKGPKPGRTNSTSGIASETKPAATKEEDTTEPAEEDTSIADGESADVSMSSKKKRVSWAASENLTQIHFFEMDDSERVNVNRNFLDAANKEKMREREALESGLMFSRDRLFEMVAWQHPFPIDLTDDLVDRGADSKERLEQTERENTVLAQLFLTKASVPPSPLEPDPESEANEKEPKLIPLMEPGAPPTSGPPAPLHPLPPPPTLPPAVFASPTNVSAPTNSLLPPDSPLPSPATTINQAQNLINFFNKQQQQHQQQQQQHQQQQQQPQHQQHQVDHGKPSGTTTADQPRQNQAFADFHPRPDHNGANAGPGGFQGNNPDNFPPNMGHPHHGQGEGPGSTPPRGYGKWGGPEGRGGGGGGNYYGDNYYQGQRGRGFHRGRGRGSFPPWRRGGAKLCKHFQGYQGCKLGSRCRFMHCTQDEFNQMNADQGGFGGPGGRNFRGRGGRRGFGGPPRNYETKNGEMFGPQQQGAFSHPLTNVPASYSPPYAGNEEGSPHKGNQGAAAYSPPTASRQADGGRHPSENQGGREHDQLLPEDA